MDIRPSTIAPQPLRAARETHMPLILGCAHQNPAGPALPAAPAAAAAHNLAPAQGDNVFGYIVGTLNNSFQLIFGGGQNMATRIRNFNATLAGLWQGFAALEFGHGAAPPLVNRNGAPEPDEHAH